MTASALVARATRCARRRCGHPAETHEWFRPRRGALILPGYRRRCRAGGPDGPCGCVCFVDPNGDPE